MIVPYWILSTQVETVCCKPSDRNPGLDSKSHCKGKGNPADFLTRGQTFVSLSQSLLWWNGPMFLTLLEPVEASDEELVVVNMAEELTLTESVLDLYSKLKTVLQITT